MTRHFDRREFRCLCGCGKDNISPTTIVAIAEHLGFSGIGLMATNVHVDIRDKTNYINAHWFGSEVTGENIDTFKKYLPALPVAKHKITVMYDDKIIIETEV